MSMLAYHLADTIIVKTTNSLETVIEIPYEAEADVALAFSPDGSIIVASNFHSDEIRIFSLDDGKSVGRIAFTEYMGYGGFTVFKFTDPTTLLGVRNHRLFRFDIEPMTVTEEHVVVGGYVGGEVMAVSNSDTVVRQGRKLFLVNGESSVELKIADVFHTVEFSGNGQRFAVRSEYGVSVFSNTGEILCVLFMGKSREEAGSMGLNYDGTQVVIFANNRVVFTSIETMTELRRIVFTPDSGNSRIAVNADGRCLVVGGYNTRIAIIDPDDVEFPSEILQDDRGDEIESLIEGFAVHDPYTVLL
jgi:WD40 repeat protein